MFTKNISMKNYKNYLLSILRSKYHFQQKTHIPIKTENIKRKNTYKKLSSNGLCETLNPCQISWKMIIMTTATDGGTLTLQMKVAHYLTVAQTVVKD